MLALTKKFKKLKVHPVTGKEAQTEEELKWENAAQAVKGKIGMKPVDISHLLTDPDVVQNTVEQVKKDQVPGVIMKAVQDIDKDRIMEKRLALNVAKSRGSQINSPGPAVSLPIVTIHKKTPKFDLKTPQKGASGGTFPPPPIYEGMEKEESRPFTQTELSDLSKQFAQNGTKDASYMVKLWEQGADTVMLHEKEMRRIKNIIENPTIYEALEQVLEASRGETKPLLDWLTSAWRFAFPTLDLTQFEAAGKWVTYQDAISPTRKLGILYYIYNEVETPQASTMIPGFAKIILKGAPAHLRASLAGPVHSTPTA